MKVPLYDLTGKVVEERELPPVFEVEVRLDLIKRAVLSEESELFQPKGAYRFAGMETSAEYIGRKEAYRSLKNRGQAMLPREKFPKGRWGRVRRIPSAVGGRRAHPPKVEKVLKEEINNKEYLKALASALASTADKELVKNRLRISQLDAFPVLLKDDFSTLSKTKDVLKVLSTIGLDKEIEWAKEHIKRVTGVRRRKKGKDVPRSLLIIVSDGAILRAARNLPGVDVVKVEELKVKHLAPGCLPGRPTLFTESALVQISKRFEQVV